MNEDTVTRNDRSNSNTPKRNHNAQNKCNENVALLEKGSFKNRMVSKIQDQKRKHLKMVLKRKDASRNVWFVKSNTATPDLEERERYI